MKTYFKQSYTILLLFVVSTTIAQNRPYPQQMNWSGCIKPNNISQATMDGQVSAYYDYWKGLYLKPSDFTPNAYYIQGENTGGSGADKGTSEGHGYGMIITALMAGYDGNAKVYYDGLYKMYDNHRSSINTNLMGWLIDANETGSGSNDSATDGDLDIAYSLLLAHYQWGSAGTINYLVEAKRIINAIKASNINSSNRINLGDWDNNAYNTRPSDWMFDHFQAFYNNTNDATWTSLSSNLYSIMNTVSTNYSSTTGLMPDFVVGNTPVPAAANFLEGANDGNYYYNACRVPMRVVMDYGHYGNTNAKTHVNKMVNWVKTKTTNNPSLIRAGYLLNGNNIAGNNYQDAVFISPFIAASVCDVSHQAFLNSGWSLIVTLKENYFSDTYNLMNMLFITGNWWIPTSIPLSLEEHQNIYNENKTILYSTLYPNPSLDEITLLIDKKANIVDVELLDSTGQLLESIPIISSEHTFKINLAQYSKGSYLIRVKTTEGVELLKLIKP